MNENAERYWDFSEDDEVIAGFYGGDAADKQTKALSSQLQSALQRRNPATSIRQLLAFQTTLQHMVLKQVKILLRINSALLLIIVLVLLVKL